MNPQTRCKINKIPSIVEKPVRKVGELDADLSKESVSFIHFGQQHWWPVDKNYHQNMRSFLKSSSERYLQNPGQMLKALEPYKTEPSRFIIKKEEKSLKP
jgi:hypothetical protein